MRKTVPLRISKTAMRLTILTAVTFCGWHSPFAHDTKTQQNSTAPHSQRWLAGDHHVHSHYSVKWSHKGGKRPDVPPVPRIAGDAIYSIETNAQKARQFGLDWMVNTDHGGPNHSKLNLERAYPDLVKARRTVDDLILFYGMEFDTPGAEHSSLIIPHTHDEAQHLYELESKFANEDAYPPDPARKTEARMLEALAHMRTHHTPPLLIANHPARSMKDGAYTKYTPAELRNWHTTAPTVAVGMESAPGHQALAIRPDGSIAPDAPRGGYNSTPTYGGFDILTATLGGFWDSMLQEGRRWWITITSDSHRNWRDGGDDFWPGEYSKTYVYAEKTYDAIIDGLRHGRTFVVTGDLISELYVTAQSSSGETGHIGGTLAIKKGDDVEITVRFLDPDGKNARGDAPSVARVDLIAGDVTGPTADPMDDRNETTRVVLRADRQNWQRDGQYYVINHTLKNVENAMYIRIRGTNTDELEPAQDPRGEDPWSDLWFYANPVFIEVQ